MKRVLVCVLDWGLGHATRSIPVIRELQQQGAEVFLASSGSAGALLKQEFPILSFHELPGYRPHYPRQGSFLFSMAAQLPKFRRAIQREQREVEALVTNFRIHAVISDNRYGCFSQRVPSILITHQVKVRLMPGFGLVEKLVNAWLETYLNKYHEVWVPDQPGSGLTDRFMERVRDVRYIGWLSRFPTDAKPADPFPVMAIVSGPEPQRSLLADKLRTQLRSWPGRSLLVTGQPDKHHSVQDGNVEVVSHLPSSQMEARLKAADLVIARSGYSTIMDLIALRKRASFIPTPGQPEQIHLADFIMRSGIAFCQDQKNFTVQSLVEESSRYAGWSAWNKEEGLLASAIKQLLS